ncbi:MerR family transcriptional regulator [Marinomonas piezotolerans]|uniref:MerR family transcriptional regulator n=1 Tax=Marinomonas piezotolerans TaxID=2213058 RepID=A0A370UE98_9GAMM|nr:MerR family DNA-binding protein [Marinomonas piezotolerans]RDL46045.1 MerR family transcriptional regulator [Marinomonas piezotolerans]
MKVSDLAKTAKVTPETVRHYSRQGLIHAQRNAQNGYQEFDNVALQRVRFIQQARTLGFSLKQIAQIFEQSDSGDSPCPMVRDLLRQKVPETQKKIADLQAHLIKMEAALTAWEAMEDGVPNGHSICCLIEDWETSDASQCSEEK